MSLQEASPRRVFDERFALILAASDLAGCAASVVIAYAVRCVIPQLLLEPIQHDIGMYVRAIPAVAGLWLITFYGFGLYGVRGLVSAVGEMTAVFRAVTLTTLMVAAASFLSHTDYSRAMLFLFWACALGITVCSRSVLRQYAERARARGEAKARALVVGCGELGRLVAERIGHHHLLGYELVGFVSVLERPEEVGGYPVVGGIAELEALVERYDVDEVLVARPELDPGTLMTAIQACENMPVEFHLLAGPLQVLTEHAEISGLADLPVIELPSRRLPAWQHTVKRVMDVALSAVLLILCSPLMLAVAWLVRRATKASAIFRQTRVGYRGAEFTMYKFRTMAPSADPYAEAPEDLDDERITRTGGWLRRSSLDELPQLFNVLKGDMSLVGPRPEMPFIVEQYEPWQRRRLDVKPGITGLWQILGRKDLPLRDNIEYDFYYIRNWSIWLDVAILLKTIPIVIWGRGAY